MHRPTMRQSGILVRSQVFPALSHALWLFFAALPAFTQTAGAGPEFDVRLGVGINYIAYQDYNDRVDYYNTAPADADYSSVPAFHFLFNGEAEGLMTMKRLSFGLGFNYGTGSVAHYPDQDEFTVMSGTHKLNIFSVSGTFYYTLKKGYTYTLYSGIGPAWYSCQAEFSGQNYYNVTTWTPSGGTSHFSGEDKLNSKFSASQLGFQVILGLEYPLGDNLAMDFSAIFRYARISGFKGTYEWSGYWDSSLQEGSRDAWLVYEDDGSGWVWFGQGDNPDTDQNPDTRPGIVDLTGVGIRVGFRVNLTQ